MTSWRRDWSLRANWFVELSKFVVCEGHSLHHKGIAFHAPKRLLAANLQDLPVQAAHCGTEKLTGSLVFDANCWFKHHCKLVCTAVYEHVWFVVLQNHKTAVTTFPVLTLVKNYHEHFCNLQSSQ